MAQEQPASDDEVHAEKQRKRDGPEWKPRPRWDHFDFVEGRTALALAVALRFLQGIEYEGHGSTAVRVSQIEDGRIRRRYGARQDDLSLHAGDAVDGEAMPPLKLAYEPAEVGIENVTHRPLATLALNALQTLPQPAYLISTHPFREGFHLAGARAPEHHEITEPVP